MVLWYWDHKLPAYGLKAEGSAFFVCQFYCHTGDQTLSKTTLERRKFPMFGSLCCCRCWVCIGCVILTVITRFIIQDSSKRAKSSHCFKKSLRSFDVTAMTALSGDTQPCWTVTSNCSRSLSLSSFHHLTILRYRHTHTHAHRTITNVTRALASCLKARAHTYTELPRRYCPLAKHVTARTIFLFNLLAPLLRGYRFPLRLHPNYVSSQLGHSEQGVGSRKGSNEPTGNVTLYFWVVTHGN